MDLLYRLLKALEVTGRASAEMLQFFLNADFPWEKKAADIMKCKIMLTCMSRVGCN